MKYNTRKNIATIIFLEIIIWGRVFNFREYIYDTDELLNVMWANIKVSEISGLALDEVVYTVLWQLFPMVLIGTYLYDNVFNNMTLIYTRKRKNIIYRFMGGLIAKILTLCFVYYILIYITSYLEDIKVCISLKTLYCLCCFIIFVGFICIAVNVLSFIVDAKYAILIMCAFNITCMYLYVTIPQVVAFTPFSLLLVGIHEQKTGFLYITLNLAYCLAIMVAGDWFISRREYY